MRSGSVQPISYRELVVRNRLPASSVMVHRACIEAVGLFDDNPDMLGVEDWDLWLRVAMRYPVYLVSLDLATIRLVRGSISAVENTVRIFKGEQRVLAKLRALPRPQRPSLLLYARARTRSHLGAAWGEMVCGNGDASWRHLLIALLLFPPCVFSRNVIGILYTRVRGNR